MDVKGIVERTVRKYGTRSPYELADLMDIKITRCELGKIKGFYLYKYRIKQIALNCDLSPHEERFVLSHEIGHSIMHPRTNTTFLCDYTFLSTNKLEIQANKFAIELLIPNEVILENWKLTTSRLARLTGYSEALIQLRLQ